VNPEQTVGVGDPRCEVLVHALERAPAIAVAGATHTIEEFLVLGQNGHRQLNGDGRKDVVGSTLGSQTGVVDGILGIPLPPL